jgi:thiol-disulfide isomerase/thioredoxin
MRLTALLLLLLLFTSTLKSQNVLVTDFKGLESLLNQQNDTTYIVNFWATWCIPCVKEMPYFQKLHDEFSGDKVKVVLVSLDFQKHLETRLKPFIEKYRLTPQVILLNDADANSWINKVSPEWSGALPATLFYNRNFRTFYEKSFTYEELQTIVKQNLIEK